MPVHPSPQPLLYIPGFHELVYIDSIGLLLETPSLLPGIKHPHDREHSAHGRTWALCPLVTVPHHRHAVMMYPNCLNRIHLRKRSRSTIGELITMLLIDLAQYLKSYHLNTFPRGPSLRLSAPALPLWRLSTSKNSCSHHKPRVPLHILLVPRIAGWLRVPRKVQHPPEQGGGAK
jgi:hypothetical protein